MKLQLKRPLAIFDLEATGLDVTNDRIVEIAILRVDLDGSTAEYVKRVNPVISISEEAFNVHGISNEDVKSEKTFVELAPEIAAFIGDADLAGYNSNKFDIPLLAEEFLRAESDFDISSKKFVDVQNIFHKMEQRTLVAAYAFYCNKDLTNAHQAMADVTATWEVLQAQLVKYENLESNVEFLANFTRTGNFDLLDFAGRIAINDKGEAIYNFGKHKGKSVKEVMVLEPGYYGWMMDANFPLYTKQVLKKEMEKIRTENASKKQVSQKEDDDLQSKLEALKNKFK
ncbi:MAG: exonuclease domain-containing protein [Crocinitomicaceae bacterium]|nr:exonuclease domain-containing protein [Crocinitomicaceae bacterium]